ncbi:TSUP family transporter [Actinomadura madurae]|uniref:TSUP family transporter n=1 Tax=Actinomadura madurae TaxID=1993 RepID=UPI003999D95F
MLGVPSPAVTPTNLLFNVVAGPGALARHHRQGDLAGPLTRLLIAGTLPGVMLGASIRVFVVPGPTVFRVLVALLLLPLGLWLCVRAVRPPKHQTGQPSTRFITALALAVRTVGGIYGIGGRPHPGGPRYAHRPRRSGRARIHLPHFAGGRGHVRGPLAHAQPLTAPSRGTRRCVSPPLPRSASSTSVGGFERRRFEGLTVPVGQFTLQKALSEEGR